MRTLFSLAFLLTLSSALLATDSELPQEATVKMRQFKAANPEARFMGTQYFDGDGFFEIDGTADYIYGTTLSNGTSAIESATNFCNKIDGIYAEEVGNLVPGTVHGVMFNKATQSHKFSTIRFQQTVGGVPVFRSGIGFLVRNEENFPLVLSSNNYKELKDFDAAAAAFALPTPTQVMLTNTGAFLDTSAPSIGGKAKTSVLEGARRAAPKLNITEEQLVIWAGVTNVKVEPELAISFMAERGTIADPDNYRRFLIIAAVDDGEILHTENQVSTLDVDGTVSGNATNNGATFVCGPELPFALPYGGVQILGGASGFADADGNFSLSSGDGNVTLRSSLRGQFFEVFDQSAGNSTPFVDVTANSPGTVDSLFNTPATDLNTANVIAYLHSNIVRDFVLSFEPNYPIIANQTLFDTNTNIADSCNAFYNGVSTNYFTAGGNCNNTAFGDVVYHEYGHHLVQVTGNSQGQFGEGSGDTIGMLIEDDPVLGQGFSNCGNGIRSALNFRQYPCFDQASPHDCGQLLSGSVWDLRNELATVDPSNARDIATSLFIGMLIVRGQTGGSSMIGPEVPLIMLELDDDDANIGNGTPHYQQIADAFNPHNLTVPELEAIFLTLPNGAPATLAPEGGSSFLVDVSANSSTAAPDTGLLHYNDGSGFVTVPMTVVDSETYSAEFPAACGLISFFVSVETADGETVTLPTEAPAEAFSAVAANSIVSLFQDSFDTATGWTVSGNATDGQWERAVPNNGDRGDPANDAESAGAGFCYVTDNGNFGTTNTDVDGGSTTLTSPIMDATEDSDEVAVLTYFRWYSNDFGASPNADIFVVEISNDGGSTWINLETVGPTGPGVEGGWIQRQVQVSTVIEPTDNMRVRFTASDLGDGSVVEAGVDGVSIDVLACAAEVLCGDVNLDGVVNLLDVAPFVDLISNGGFQLEADINGDGSVDLLDIGPFVEKLSGG